MLALFVAPADAGGSRGRGGFLSDRNAEVGGTTVKKVKERDIRLCIILCMMWVWHSHDAKKGREGWDAILYLQQFYQCSQRYDATCA